MTIENRDETRYWTEDDLAHFEGERVCRDEPHWYLTVYDNGCALCCYAPDGGVRRVRVRGKRPADRPSFIAVGGDWACGDHFV